MNDNLEYIEDEEILLEIPDDEVQWSEEADIYEAKGIWFRLEDMVSDFEVFAVYMFKRMGFEEPTRMQREIIKFIGSSNSKDKMVQAMRGVGKSMITQIYVLWRLLRNPDEHILVRSASSKRSRNFTTFLLNLIKTTPPLQHLTPTSSQRKSTELFDVNGASPSDSPSVISSGISANVTGFRSTLIIADDIEVQGNSATSDLREKLLEQFNESINLLVESEYITGEVIVLGTPQSSESIYINLIQTGAFSVFMCPAEYPIINEWYQDKLAPFIVEDLKNNPDLVGMAIDTRFNMDVLNKRKLRIGKSAYALQYLMNPIFSDELKYPLKLKDLICMDIDPTDNPIRIIYSSEEKIKGIKHKGYSSDYLVAPAWCSEERGMFQFTIMAIDPSGKGSDETGWVVVSLLAGKVFIRDFGGLTGGYDDDNLDTLVAIAKKYNVNKIVVESNFGDGAYLKMLERKLLDVHNCETEDVRVYTQKESRIISTLEPLMNQHRIIVDRRAIEKDTDKNPQYSFTYQLTHLSKDKGCLAHDDIIDAISLGVSQMVEYMATGERKAVKTVAEDKAKKIAEVMKKGLFPHLATNYNLSSNYGSRY